MNRKMKHLSQVDKKCYHLIATVNIISPMCNFVISMLHHPCIFLKLDFHTLQKLCTYVHHFLWLNDSLFAAVATFVQVMINSIHQIKSWFCAQCFSNISGWRDLWSCWSTFHKTNPKYRIWNSSLIVFLLSEFSLINFNTFWYLQVWWGSIADMWTWSVDKSWTSWSELFASSNHITIFHWYTMLSSAKTDK